jgi:hypothetical protein
MIETQNKKKKTKNQQITQSPAPWTIDNWVYIAIPKCFDETSHEQIFLIQEHDYWRVPCGH